MKFKDFEKLIQYAPDGVGGGTGEGTDNGGTGEGAKGPSYEELVAELAKERADRERFKNANDKLSKEIATVKQNLREKMTAEEQLAEEQKQQREEHEREFEEMKRELAETKSVKKLMGTLGMDEELATDTAKAISDNDTDKIFENLAKHIKSVEEASYQKAIKDRPSVPAGNGSDSVALAKAKELAKTKSVNRATANSDILKNYI